MDAAARLTLGIALDIDRASEQELLNVPGMKPEWARYIALRREKAPWRTLEELEEISGVGPKTVEKWREYLTVGTRGLE